jgi:hypothetical protein
MNALQNRGYEEQRLQLEAALAARIDTLFRRCPALCGFSVQEGSKLPQERAADHIEGDLFLADLECHPALDPDRSAELCEAISHALLELVDERPEMAELLPGRTFARTLH